MTTNYIQQLRELRDDSRDWFDLYGDEIMLMRNSLDLWLELAEAVEECQEWWDDVPVMTCEQRLLKALSKLKGETK